MPPHDEDWQLDEGLDPDGPSAEDLERFGSELRNCPSCGEDVYDQAGITPKDIDCAEIYVPFSWFEPMWLENLGFCEVGEGWKYTMDGKTRMDGEIPFNMSGGVMCTNPIGASGMLRFAEAARQVRGTADAHQVDGAKIALGHAYGGGSQFFAMWAVGKERP